VRSAKIAARPRPGSSARRGKRLAWPAATHERHAFAAWSPHAVRACGGAVERSRGGPVGAGRWQGVADEHRWGPGVAPHRRSGGGAHPSGGSTREGRSGSVGTEAMAGVREDKAPMSGGAVRWLEVEAREVAAARRQAEREKSWVGEKTRPAAAAPF
jgi:hypothetical protein